MAKGMGFKAAAKAVAKKSGMPAKQAKAAIAAGARNASPAAKKANPALKKVAGKKAPAKKANPFAKKMSDSPGSMDGGSGTARGLGAAQVAAKRAARKVAPKAMGEVPKGTMNGQQRQQSSVTSGTRTNRVTKPSGTAGSTGNRMC